MLLLDQNVVGWWRLGLNTPLIVSYTSCACLDVPRDQQYTLYQELIRIPKHSRVKSNVRRPSG